jgi:hypothetical protein
VSASKTGASTRPPRDWALLETESTGHARLLASLPSFSKTSQAAHLEAIGPFVTTTPTPLATRVLVSRTLFLQTPAPPYAHQTKTLTLNARRIPSHLQATFRLSEARFKHASRAKSWQRASLATHWLQRRCAILFHAALGAGSQAHPAEPLHVLRALSRCFLS